MWYQADDDQQERVANRTPALDAGSQAKDATWPPPDGPGPQTTYYQTPMRKPPQRETALDEPGTEYWLP